MIFAIKKIHFVKKNCHVLEVFRTTNNQSLLLKQIACNFWGDRNSAIISYFLYNFEDVGSENEERCSISKWDPLSYLTFSLLSADKVHWWKGQFSDDSWSHLNSFFLYAYFLCEALAVALELVICQKHERRSISNENHRIIWMVYY